MEAVMWILKKLGVVNHDISDLLGGFDKLQRKLSQHVENMAVAERKQLAKAALAQAKAVNASAQGKRAATIVANLTKLLDA